jgi:hypothetical protein
MGKPHSKPEADELGNCDVDFSFDIVGLVWRTREALLMTNFSRRLGLVETLFATLHSMGAMLYVNIASIEGVISLDVLRSAIDLLQKRHPLLQVYLQESDQGFIFCADGTSIIPLRSIDRQHEQQWIEIAEDELLQKFSGGFEPLCRMTLLQESEKNGRNELIIMRSLMGSQHSIL